MLFSHLSVTPWSPFFLPSVAHVVPALARVSIARIKHHDPSQQQTRQNWQARVYFTHILQTFTEGSQEPEAETTEEAAYWPAPHGLLSLLFYGTQGHLPRDGPSHINHQSRKCTPGLPIGQFGWGIFSVVLSPQ